MSKRSRLATGIALFVQSGLLFIALAKLAIYRRLVVEQQSKLVHYKKKLHAERKGRIGLQQKARSEKGEIEKAHGYSYKAIGFVDSPFPDRRGTPRQPSLVPAARGRINFNMNTIQQEHFAELKSFSHIWVIFVFNENTNDGETVSAKVKPPRLGGEKVGCLSTRSPHRPNNIGLSVCEIVSVGSTFIEIAGVDMVCGTPVLDVKPYIPYDVVASSYAIPTATTCSGELWPRSTLRVPNWINETEIEQKNVEFLPEVVAALSAIEEQAGFRLYRHKEPVMDLIAQVLRQDIRSVHKGRGAGNGTEKFMCHLDTLTIHFTTSPTAVIVREVVLSEDNNKEVADEADIGFVVSETNGDEILQQESADLKPVDSQADDASIVE